MDATPGEGTITRLDKVITGQWKWSGCSGFGQTSFSQGENESTFLQIEVLNKSSSVIF